MSRPDTDPLGPVELRKFSIPVNVAVSTYASASAAGFTLDPGSNSAKLPPVPSERTDSARPGRPRPRVPNSEDWATSGSGAAQSRTSGRYRRTYGVSKGNGRTYVSRSRGSTP